jgi:Flp pilus assembly protein TadB
VGETRQFLRRLSDGLNSPTTTRRVTRWMAFLAGVLVSVAVFGATDKGPVILAAVAVFIAVGTALPRTHADEVERDEARRRRKRGVPHHEESLAVIVAELREIRRLLEDDRSDA